MEKTGWHEMKTGRYEKEPILNIRNKKSLKIEWK